MDITRILAPNPGPFTGAGTNSYLVRSGGEAALIDPGPMLDSHLAAIRSAVADLRLVAILVTHHHLDHSPAANPLASEYRVPSIGYGSFGGFQAISSVADGDVVHVGTEVIEVLKTPGHTPDSLCFSVVDGVFTGDTIKAGTTVVVEDMSAYMATLQRLAGLAPPRLFPGHGEVIEDAPAAIAGYIDHRQQREGQILASLVDGSRDIGAVTATVYPDLDPALIPLATQSAAAHLRKLEDDGLVVRAQDRWGLR